MTKKIDKRIKEAQAKWNTTDGDDRGFTIVCRADELIDALKEKLAAVEAENARLTAERDAAQPVAWLCEDQTFQGECRFERKPERAAYYEREDDWIVTPLYAHPAPDTLRQVREALAECLDAETRRRKKLKDGAPASEYTEARMSRVRAAIALLTKEGE